MKKGIRKITATALAIIAGISAVASSVLAASEVATLKLWPGTVKEHEVITEFGSTSYTGDILYSMIDGNVAYCMNFMQSADGWQKMVSSNNHSTILSELQEKQLSFCMYYGHGNNIEEYPTNEQRNEYIATQAIVWNIEKNLFGTSAADSAAKKFCVCAPNSTKAYSYYEDVRDKIQTALNVDIPSFATDSMDSAESYLLKWNEDNQRYEITLNDENGMLENFDFSASGFSLEKNGNKLTIYTEESNTKDTLVTGKEARGAVKLASGCVYWTIDKKDYQEFISARPQVVPVYAYFKVRTESFGSAKLVKTDKNSGTALEGAAYGIYSDNSCKNLLVELTTNRSGIAEVNKMTPGTYYVKEITAPKGYILDESIYTLVISSDKNTVLEVMDREQMGSISIYKEGEVLTGWDGTNFVYEVQRISGATYEVTAKEDIYRADGTKAYSEGDLIGKMTTNEDGLASISGLFLGTYSVMEVEAPYGYTLSEEEHVVILSDDGTEAIVEAEFTVFNERQKSKIEVKKLDTDSKIGLRDAEFGLYADEEIVNVKGTSIVKKDTLLEKAVSDESGNVSFHTDCPSGKYYVKELTAPEGYVLDKNIHEANVTPGKTTTVTVKDKEQMGSISIYKEGEVLTGWDGTDFIYEMQRLSGATYEITAKEDIYRADGTKAYSEGDLIGRMTTDEEGNASISGLHLGTYGVMEVEAPKGYVLDQEEKVITLSSVDSSIAVIEEIQAATNERQKLEIQVEKMDVNTQTGLEGAQIGLCALEDILDWQGKLLVEKNTLLETGISDKDGKVAFRVDYPLGNYYVKEIAAPSGYVKSEEMVEIDGTYREPEQSVICIQEKIENSPIRIDISKVDVTGEYEIPGAKLSVWDERGNLIDTWVSDGSAHRIERILSGTYILREEIAPYGYHIATDIVFEVTESQEIQRVVMKDEIVKGKIQITKIDEETKLSIPGTEFEIRDEKGNVVDTIVTDADGKAESKELDIAVFDKGVYQADVKYYVVETKPVEGYLKQDSVQEVIMHYENEPPEIVVCELEVTNKQIEIETPQTGDTFNTWVWIGVGMLSMGILIVLYKKLNKE